jgi:hypothetical protein
VLQALRPPVRAYFFNAYYRTATKIALRKTTCQPEVVDPFGEKKYVLWAKKVL